VVTIRWDEAYRIIYSRYPFVSIFDEISDPADLDAIIELEQRTNDRIRNEIGELALIRPEDRIAGPGTTPIMADFTHARESRFGDGSYGVYYAARRRDTAICETVYHVQRFYRDTREVSADVDMRVYAAAIAGSFDDLLSAPATDPRLDPQSYLASRAYARPLYNANVVDGIAYPSVRDPARGACLACFRARSISACYTHSYLTYRWDGTLQRIVDVFERGSLADPDTRG
jgi:hypothetical protein